MARKYLLHAVEIIAFLTCGAGSICSYYSLWPWYAGLCVAGIAAYGVASSLLAQKSENSYARTAYTGNLCALVALSLLALVPGQLSTIIGLVLFLMAGAIAWRTMRNPNGEPKKGKWTLDSM